MSETKFTPGPWRWEINEKHKQVHLVGGVPKYDLTIMDFTRWGMGGAGIKLRDTAVDGMNAMHKLHERPDWIEPFGGREHHQSWCANVVHPDMRLIAAAPDLLHLVETANSAIYGTHTKLWQDKARAAIAKARGES